MLPSGVEVVQGQVNRTPSPAGPDYVVMQAVLAPRLSTNLTSYSDLSSGSTITIEQPTENTVQLDVHGPNAADNATIISALFRSGYACDFFTAQNVDIQPLYAEQPRQMQFITGEGQYEPRWIVDVVMQSNPSISFTQGFADELAIHTINPVI